MNKLNVKLLLLTAFAVLAVSCGKKEGVIDRDNRIDGVDAIESGYLDNQLYYSTGDFVEEDWHWDGKMMYRIDYRGDHPYSENFFYDGRRLERTTVPAYGIRSEFFYDGRQLEHIDFFRNDSNYMTVRFTHDDGQLSEIVVDYFSNEVDTSVVAVAMHSNPLAALLGAELASKLEAQSIERFCASNGKGVRTRQTRYELTWTDNNVTAIKCTDADGVRKIALTYDDKRNPYNQLFGYRELSDPMFGFEMLSENNITSIRMPYRFSANQLFSYSYEYDGSIPTKRTLTYSYPVVNGQNFDSAMYKYVKVETFKYVE